MACIDLYSLFKRLVACLDAMIQKKRRKMLNGDINVYKMWVWKEDILGDFTILVLISSTQQKKKKIERKRKVNLRFQFFFFFFFNNIKYLYTVYKSTYLYIYIYVYILFHPPKN